MDDWRPIETKPKNHFPCLVWGPFGHRVAFQDVTWAWWEPAAVEPMDWKPSHWMPLPVTPGRILTTVLCIRDGGGK